MVEVFALEDQTDAQRPTKVVTFGEHARTTGVLTEQLVELGAKGWVRPCVAKCRLEFLARWNQRLRHKAATKFTKATLY